MMKCDDKVTIGLPVYNEECYLEETFDNIIQNMGYIHRLIISDNCSTDRSGIICRKYAEQFPGKIEYISTNKLIPARDNFIRILRSADSKYFMFWRVKNILSPDYVGRSLRALLSEPDAIAAIPDVYYGYLENKIIERRKLKLFRKFPARNLVQLSSADRKTRVEATISHINMIDHIIYWLCDRESLINAFSRTLENVSAYDTILGLHMAISGRWTVVSDVSYKYYLRHETFEELSDRYVRDVGCSIKKVNPFGYLPKEYWRICNNYVPEVCDDALKNKIIREMSCKIGAEWNDEDWFLKNTPGRFLQLIADKATGKEIVFLGAGKDGEKIYKAVNGRVKVSFFIDHSKEKQQKLFLGKKVRPVETVTDTREYVVCITSALYNLEMMNEMIGMGYSYMENLFCLAGAIPYECL